MSPIYALIHDGRDIVRLGELTVERLRRAREEAEKLVEEIDGELMSRPAENTEEADTE